MIANLIKISLSTLALSTYIKEVAIQNSYNINDSITKPKYKISIIIPVYNEERFIKTTLESIKNQTIVQKFPDNFEIILIDSDSTDNTINISKPYVDKILNIRGGKLSKRNYALQHINGTITVSVDGDCIYPPNWLNLMIKSFDNPNVVAVCGLTYDNLPQYGYLKNKFGSLIFHIAHSTFDSTRLQGCNSAYYTDIHKLELFNEKTNQFYLDDMMQEEEVNFGKKLSKYGIIKYNNKAMCIHLGGIKFACRTGYNPSNEFDKLYCNEIKNKSRF